MSHHDETTHPRPKRFDLPLVLLLLFVLGGRLVVAGADPRALVSENVWSDDAFYYLKIAKNVVGGRGLTFDGTATTNGFHPLWLAAMIPVTAATDDPFAPMTAAGAILAGVAAATGWFLYRAVRRAASRRAALFALALWAIAPYFLLHTVNGLETGFALLFTALLLDRWTAGVDRNASFAGDVRFGLLAGVGLLARIDLVFLLAAFAGEAALRRRVSARGVRRAAVIASACLLVWLPWGVVSKSATGSFLPKSGEATRTIARGYGWANLPMVWTARDGADPFFDPDHPPPSFSADVVTKGAFVLLLEHPLLAPLRAALPVASFSDPARWWAFESFRAFPALGAAILVLLAGAVFAGARRLPAAPDERSAAARALSRTALLYGVFTLAAYAFYAPAHWFFGRYFAGALLASTTALTARLAPAFGAWMSRGGARAAAALAAPLLLLAFHVAALRTFAPLFRPAREASGFLADWPRFAKVIGDHEKIGAFQAGTFGWFSGRDVIDLDGKVNPEALRALEEKRLHEYLLEKDIRYVMDWEWVFVALCLRHAPPGSIDVKRVITASTPADASLYRVGPP